MGIGGVNITSNASVTDYLARRGVKIDSEADRILGQAFDQGDKTFVQGDDRITDGEGNNFTDIVKQVLDNGATVYDLPGSKILADGVITATEARNLVAQYHKDLLFKSIKDKKNFDVLWLLKYGGPDRKGIALNVKDPQGNTPLMVAARSGSLDSLSLLITSGAELQARNANGETALMLAAQQGEAMAISMLLTKLGKEEAKAYTNLTDTRVGMTALQMIGVSGDDSKQYEVKSNGLPSMNKFIRSAMLLLARGADKTKAAADAIKKYDDLQKKKASGEYFESYDSQGSCNYMFLDSFVQMFSEYDQYLKTASSSRLTNYLSNLNKAATALLVLDQRELDASLIRLQQDQALFK